MAPVSKIQKEDIINACLEIVRECGIDVLNARMIAKRLNCSTQPIFYHFSSMEEIKEELLKVISDYYRDYQNNVTHVGFEYKDTGINYIKFAKEEPNLFKLIFMNNKNVSPEVFLQLDEAYSDVEKFISMKTGFDKEKIKKFHLKMWMFIHGIACLIVTNTCNFTEEEISELLTEEFTALMLLEKRRNEGNSL